MVTSSDWEKSNILAVGHLWAQHHVLSVRIRVSKMSGLEIPRDVQTKYLWPDPLLRHPKACNFVPVGVEVGTVQPVAEVSQNMMARVARSGQESRDEWTKSRIDPRCWKQTACSRRVCLLLLNLMHNKLHFVNSKR